MYPLKHVYILLISSLQIHRHSLPTLFHSQPSNSFTQTYLFTPQSTLTHIPSLPFLVPTHTQHYTTKTLASFSLLFPQHVDKHPHTSTFLLHSKHSLTSFSSLSLPVPTHSHPSSPSYTHNSLPHSYSFASLLSPFLHTQTLLSLSIYTSHSHPSFPSSSLSPAQDDDVPVLLVLGETHGGVLHVVEGDGLLVVGDGAHVVLGVHLTHARRVADVLCRGKRR